VELGLCTFAAAVAAEPCVDADKNFRGFSVDEVSLRRHFNGWKILLNEKSDLYRALDVLWQSIDKDFVMNGLLVS
jgi:hypothetical protein